MTQLKVLLNLFIIYKGVETSYIFKISNAQTNEYEIASSLTESECF